MATRYVDFSGGNNANDGSSFANRVKTIDANGMTAARHAAGDTIRIMKSPDPTQLSVNATWTNGSNTITLASALNKTFDNGSSWTKSANVTGTTGSGRSGSSTNLIIAAGFTTGLVAYKDLGSSQDFSAYEQISFWFQASAAVAASTFRIDLCSDAVGAVPVNQMTVTQAVASANTTRWHAIVINNGAAFGSSIRSIAIYALTDPGTVTIQLNNIIACKAATSADCLTLYSVISKQSAPSGNHGWYRVGFISGTSVSMDEASESALGSVRTYEGSTATVNTFVRQCIPVTQSSSSVLIAPQLTGADGSRILYSGGWDTTNMTSQTGETWIIQWESSASAACWDTNGKPFVDVEKIGLNNGLNILDVTTSSTNITFTDCWFLGGNNAGVAMTQAAGNITFDTCRVFSCLGTCYNVSGSAVGRNRYINCVAMSGHASGFSFVGSAKNNFCKGCVARNCQGVGFTYGTPSSHPYEYMMDTCTGSLNTTADVSSITSQLHMINCTWSSSTKYVAITVGHEATYRSMNDGAVAGTHVITGGGITVASESSVRHTASGISWKFSPTNTVWNQYCPFRLKIADVYVAAGSLVTISLWVRRDNTDQGLKLVVPAIADILTTEQSASITASANTDEQISVTFTPAVAGVVQVFAHAYINASGGTTHNSYIDDLSVSQA